MDGVEGGNLIRSDEGQQLLDLLERFTLSRRRLPMGLTVVYAKAARLIPRILGPFINLYRAVQVGIMEGQNPVVYEMLNDMAPAEHELALSVYNTLLQHVPGLRMQLTEFEDDVPALLILTGFLDAHARYARTDDIGSLRYRSMNYIPRVVLINPDDPAERSEYPLVNAVDKDKGSRGFNHLTTGRLLCPRSRRDEYNEDPEEFCCKVRDGIIAIVADDWPSFLYPEDEYNPSALDEHLLRGPWLLSIFRHVFTGPRTAMRMEPGRAGGGKPPISVKYDMDMVAPESIAYIATLGRFILNSQDEWSVDDGQFLGRKFFDNILALFNDPLAADWRASTLSWWNHWVYAAAPIVPQEDVAAQHPNGVTVLALQRAARHGN